MIYDKGSRNKTRRAKLFLSPDVRYELKHNDQLMFGDVSCVYLIENQFLETAIYFFISPDPVLTALSEKGDSGSETGSESMFQTAPTDALGKDQKQGALEGTMVIEEEGYESDESVDLLQPTQAYLTNSTATLKIAPDSEDEEDMKKNPNITVKDTPAPSRLKGISTLVLPESDSETDDEEQKKLKSNDIQTLYIEETTDNEECNETTDDEECNDLRKDIFAAATQAITDIDTKNDKTEDHSDMPTQSFVAESDDEKQDETKKKPVVKEIEITDDESTDDEDGVGPDVSHLFANPTLACDMEDSNDQEDGNQCCGMDEPTQEFSGVNDSTPTFENVSQLSQQSKKEETLVIHEGGTLAVEDVARREENKKSVVKGNDNTRVFSGDETLAVNESLVSKKALSPNVKSKNDDATQVFSGEDQTVAIGESPVSKKTLSPNVKVKDDDATQVFSGNEDQTVAINESPVSKKGETIPRILSPDSKLKNEDPTQVVSGIEDQTLAINDSPLSKKQVKMQNEQFEVKDATLALDNISEDATMAVSEETLPETKQNKRGKRNAKKAQTEPVHNEDKTLNKNITDDATVAASSEDKTHPPKQMLRGRRSVRNVRSDADISITHDATVAISDETQADSDIETKQRKTSKRGKKKSVFSTDIVDSTVAITNDTIPGSEKNLEQGKKGKKNQKKSHQKETDTTQEFDVSTLAESDYAKTAITVATGVGNDDATQVFEEPSSLPNIHVDAASSKIQFDDVSNDDTQTFAVNATIPVPESDEAKPSPRGRSRRNKYKEENKSTETVKTKKKHGEDKSNDATQTFDNDGATQVFDIGAEEDSKSIKGGISKKSDGKLSSKTKDDKKSAKDVSDTEMSEEKTAGLAANVEATQVYTMEVEDDDATPLIEPTQPYGMEDDEEAVHLNIELTQPYCLEEEMPPPDEEVNPVVPLPATSPHKSALASPNRRKQKSPSPKRVKFDVKKGMSENSEEIGNEPGTSNVDMSDTNKKSSTRVTRGKVDMSQNSSKASKKDQKKNQEEATPVVTKSTRGRRSAQVEDQEEAAPAITKSTRGRRSTQAEIQKQDEKKTTKKGRNSLPEETQKTEEEKATRKGGRRSVPAVMERNVGENKVESSEVKTRGKRGKMKVLKDIDEKNEVKDDPNNDAENPSITEKAETQSAKKARVKMSVDTVSQIETIKSGHADVGDTSSETEANKVHHINETESKTEENPTNKKTKGKRGKHKNNSEEIHKTGIEKGHETDNSVNDKTEEEPQPSVSKNKDEQVDSRRRKHGRSSIIHPVDDKSGEKESVPSNSALKDDKKPSESRGRSRKGRDSVVNKDENENKESDKCADSKDEKEVSHSTVRSKGRRGRDSKSVESVEVNVDKSVVNESVVHKSAKRGKKTENMEAKTNKNDVPQDTLAKSKRTGQNKLDNSDATINDNSDNESVIKIGKKRKAVTDDKTDSQESDTKARSKRRKVTENSDDKTDSQEADTKARSKRQKVTENTDDKTDSQESDTKARSKRQKVTENSDDSQEAKSKAGGKRQAIDQDVTQSPSSWKPANTLTVSSPSLRRKSTEPKPKVLFTGVVDEQGQRVRRTVKFLCCLSRGIPIVMPTWLENCNQNYAPYLVHDASSEKQYNFSLRKSIEKASEASVLDGYKIHVTKSVKPDPPQMEDIIKCSGGEYLKTLPKKFSDNTIVISCPDDKPLCETALKADIPVVNAEFILTVAGHALHNKNLYGSLLVNNIHLSLRFKLAEVIFNNVAKAQFRQGFSLQMAQIRKGFSLPMAQFRQGFNSISVQPCMQIRPSIDNNSYLNDCTKFDLQDNITVLKDKLLHDNG
ncbi:hypothetical protein KUTeg_016160 [Tegillarca granosa]|uniref:BRCT domain-containing protein n=1 Tax=Tegillarca granosa TaxID=220873 RepID=A0ABQ9EKA7_TEGGR|nr:hypothetical protein KUTeg_016160 [Tegillarca granosa]